MIFHCIIISVQCAALAAFLILWYFWIKKRTETSCPPDGEDPVLFPFRSFAWLFIGMVFVTCLLQIHFVRVSATVHERLAAMANFYQNQENNMRSLDEIKVMVERLRRDMETNFKGLRLQPAASLQPRPAETGQEMSVAKVDTTERADTASLYDSRIATFDAGFAREAKSSSSETSGSKSAVKHRKPPDNNRQALSMPLSRMGRVLHDRLSVKKRPLNGSPVVDYLAAGQEVKVTEKRLLNEEMWFRVVTPSGRAGWVDFRHVSLEGNS